MFDTAMCSHLVKLVIHEKYLLPGMEPKSTTLRIRRREKITKSTEFDLNDSDLEANLERAEYIGTQLDPLITENVEKE